KGLGGQGVEQFGRSAALVSLFDHHLPFLDHVHECDADERGLRRVKRFEPEHRTRDPFGGVSKLLIWYPLLRTSATSFVGGTMITQVLHCPYCHGTDIVRHGLSPEGKQRYRCRACLEGRGRTFLLEYTYAGQSPE